MKPLTKTQIDQKRGEGSGQWARRVILVPWEARLGEGNVRNIMEWGHIFVKMSCLHESHLLKAVDGGKTVWPFIRFTHKLMSRHSSFSCLTVDSGEELVDI